MVTAVTNFNITKVDRYKMGNVNFNLVHLFFIETGDDDFKYVTAGIPITPIQMGVQRLTGLSGLTSLGQQARYDSANEKVLLYDAGGDALDNDDETLQGETAVLMVLGY